jgi:hypothetical protein
MLSIPRSYVSQYRNNSIPGVAAVNPARARVSYARSIQDASARPSPRGEILGRERRLSRPQPSFEDSPALHSVYCNRRPGLSAVSDYRQIGRKPKRSVPKKRLTAQREQLEAHPPATTILGLMGIVPTLQRSRSTILEQLFHLGRVSTKYRRT